MFTSDQTKLDQWLALRLKYPQLITTCVTNDWVYHAIRAQKRFATRYQFVKTNTLILSAEHDYLVYNRAMAMFIHKAPNARLFTIPGSYHEILFESEDILDAANKVILDFFNQKDDDVNAVRPCHPLQEYDGRAYELIYNVPELVVRGIGISLSVIGVIAGIALLLGDRRK